MKNPMWGVTGAAYLRLKEPEYEDGVGTPRYVILVVVFGLFFENLGHFPNFLTRSVFGGCSFAIFATFMPFLV